MTKHCTSRGLSALPVAGTTDFASPIECLLRITEEDIRQSARPIPYSVTQVPGLDVIQTSGGEFNVRGSR